MGNCQGKSDASFEEKEPAQNGNTAKAHQKPTPSGKKQSLTKKASSRTSTIHSGILKEHNLDVYKKYTETEVLGNGSMGHVAKVVVKEEYAGGSAYVSSGGVFAKKNSTVGNAKPVKDAFEASFQSSFDDNNSQIPSTRSSAGAASTYALKSIQLEKVSTAFIEELKNEIDILKTMDHPNIVKLHEVFSHKKQIYMILELCDGGDLYTRLPYTEKDSAYITGKLLSAIKYMHDHAIVHRDLKFENIMFENKSPYAEIKVIDFGLSKKFASNKLGIMREGVGTLYSMAPQVLQGIYNSKADMWSVGVITYMLLSSHRPFYNKKRKVMIDRIMRCDYNFEKDYWNPISDEAKDFIDKLLVIDPKVRYNAQQALAHEWMHKEFKAEDRAPTASMTGRVTNNLLAYKNNNLLKKLALNVIAHRSTTDEIINLRKAFDQIDTSNDGIITSEEFKVALHDKCSYTDQELEEMFHSIDINKNGHIMYTEFIAATLETQGKLDEDRIAEAFDRLDADNTGYISKQNMLEFLDDTDMEMKDVERMIQEADTDNNGEVSFPEFLAMFRSTNQSTASNLIASLKSYDFARDSAIPEGKEYDSLLGIDAVIPGGRYDSDSNPNGIPSVDSA